jgi:signal transduction histidine kinase
VTVYPPGGRRAATAAWGALAAGAVLIGAYYLLPPDGQSIAYVAIGMLAVAGVAAGTILNLAPGQRLAWWLFVAGLACQVAGDAVFAFYEIAWDREPALPSVADAFYLAGYPLLALGAFLLVRRVAGPLTQAAFLDALIVLLAVALVQWVFFIEQYNHDDLATGARLTAMAYPAMDALLLTAIGQLLTVRGVRSTAYRLLVLSLALWVVADEAYTLGVAGYRGGSWIDALWLGSYVCWAAAALHPSVGRIVIADRETTPRLTLMRFTLLGGALLMAPTILIVEKALHHTVHLVVGVFGVLISIVVLVRIAGLLRRVERSRAAERDARRDAEVAHRLLGYQNEQLRQLDRLKDEFVSSISHELRTPLTSITGYVELLLEEEGSEQRREYLRVIERSADRLLGLVSDILFAARLQDGRLQLDFERVDMKRLVAEAVEAAKPRAESAGIALEARCNGELVVDGEPSRLAQLLDNLVSNAIKFTPTGGRVEVGAAVVDGIVHIDVSDTGMGIADDDRERLFERFFRSQTALEREIQGTGLGLYISKAIVEAHGGRIGVASVEGAGTTFAVELPAAR